MTKRIGAILIGSDTGLSIVEPSFDVLKSFPALCQQLHDDCERNVQAVMPKDPALQERLKGHDNGVQLAFP